MYKCKSKRSQMKNTFSAQDRFVSTASKKMFDCFTPSDTVCLNYHSPYVIYPIICSRFSLQYVGKTCQKINDRLNLHKSYLKNPKKFGFCWILSNHFHKGLCKMLYIQFKFWKNSIVMGELHVVLLMHQ